jgi:TolB-like protein/DNA-binding winged helix-turn-helix (wHTH) protein/Tfp pilus assembly protein PilF
MEGWRVLPQEVFKGASNRAQKMKRRHFYEFGPYRLDVLNQRLLCDGAPVPITPKSFDTLLLLVRNRERVVGKNELMRHLWPDTVVEEANLSQNIFALRKTLDARGGGASYIETIPRRGYRFAAEVKEVLEDGTAADALPAPREGLTGSPPHPRRLTWPALAAAILGLTAIGAYLLAARGDAADSIVVLPFVNAGANPDTEYLSDGITESLINNLSQLTRLRVMARTTAFSYKGRTIDPIKIGRELGVRAVLTGQVARRGDDIVIQVDLVDVEAGSQLWGEQFNRRLADMPGVQAELSREISEKLRLRLTGEEEKQLTRRSTASVEAFQQYLHGRYYLNNFQGIEEANKAIASFDRAIAIDPNYASAYAGLARAYILLGEPFNAALPPKEALREAKAAATKALALDDTLGEAHLSLAHVMQVYDWDWTGAERAYKRAIELSPSSVASHAYAKYLQMTGRHAEALDAIRRAAELDPLNLLIQSEIGFVHYTARQYDQAIEQFRKARQHLGLGWAFHEKQMYDEAIAEYQAQSRLTKPDDLAVASLGQTYGVVGRPVEARRLLDELKARSKQRFVSPYLMAYPCLGLGDREQALAWLERAYESRDQWMVWLKSDPKLDSLRPDPRFADLLRRVGL